MKTLRFLLCAAAAALSSATSATAGIISTGLVGQMGFDGSIAESSGLAGQFSIDTLGGTYAFTSDRLGLLNSAAQLIAHDSSTGTFFLGTGPNLANRSSSVSLWLRRDAPSAGFSWLFGLGHPAGVGGQTGEDMHISVNGGTGIRYSFFHDDLDLPYTMTHGQWYHLGFTFDYPTLTRKVYIDGVLLGQDVAAYAFSGGTAFKFGVPNLTVDDFRFYDRVLGSAEIAAMAGDSEAAYVLANPLSGLAAGPTGGALNGVPDGGATVALLILAMGALVVGRRRVVAG